MAADLQTQPAGLGYESGLSCYHLHPPLPLPVCFNELTAYCAVDVKSTLS